MHFLLVFNSRAMLIVVTVLKVMTNVVRRRAYSLFSGVLNYLLKIHIYALRMSHAWTVQQADGFLV